jgi:hypothetical protein
MTTDDEILARIKAKKAARKPRDHAYRNVLRRFLGKMKAGRVYSLEDIEVFIEVTGMKFTNAAPATSYAVREGYLNRVGKGRYVVTGKKIEED